MKAFSPLVCLALLVGCSTTKPGDNPKSCTDGPCTMSCPAVQGVPTIESMSFETTQGCTPNCRLLTPPVGTARHIALTFRIRDPQPGFTWRIPGSGVLPPNYVGFAANMSPEEGSAATAGPFTVQVQWYYAGGGARNDGDLGNQIFIRSDNAPFRESSCLMRLYMTNGR